MPTIQQHARFATPRPAEVQQLLTLSDERDQWDILVAQVGRMMYTLGHADGYHDGYEECGREQDRFWHRAAGRAIRGEPYTELLRRRWGPRGRTHFADPRKEDRGPGPVQPW